MPRIRVPIWLLMAAILVVALYTAGIRLLMAEITGGVPQAWAKFWVVFGLALLTIVLLVFIDDFLKQRKKKLSEPVWPPIRVPAPIHHEPPGLELGERLRLPDGSVCRVKMGPFFPLQVLLEYDPPRQRQERGGIASELIQVKADRSVWRYSEIRQEAHALFHETATDWTLDDLERIESAISY